MSHPLMSFQCSLGMLAYGADMEMAQSGKVAPLVELMASVFFGCELDSLLAAPTQLIGYSSFLVVGRDFIPGFDQIAKLRIIPPITATADAHKAFLGYGTSILEGMLEKGEIGEGLETETERTNVRHAHSSDQ